MWQVVGLAGRECCAHGAVDGLKNVVVLTTLVHLSGQLSNLRHELRSLFDAL